MARALRQGMRLVFVAMAALTLAQCASTDDDRFYVGGSENALVVIGLAEAYDAREAHYTMLWRRVENGRFVETGGGRSFEVETNSDDTIRVAGIPGEFTVVEIPPGTYALDSVFALIRERRVNYFAQGLVVGPERPSFEVRAGEAIYLGIWEARIVEVDAIVRPWRQDERDLRAVQRAADATVGDVRAVESRDISVPCEPRRMGQISQRRVC